MASNVDTVRAALITRTPERDAAFAALDALVAERAGARKLLAESSDLIIDLRSQVVIQERRVASAQSEVARLRRVIEAKDDLLRAYRMGDQRLADRALTKLEALHKTQDGGS